MNYQEKTVAVILTGAVLAIIGFDNNDAMMWAFRWNPFWRTVNYFDLGPFSLPQWYAYTFCGILPFAIGVFLLGVGVTMIILRK